MALITPSTSGNALAYQAAAGGGDTYTNSGKERVHVRNGGGSPITATLVRTAACNQGVVHAGGGVQASDQFVIGAGSDKVLPAVDPNIYGGVVGITYTGVTTVTVGVIAP
jgi:hypothetical protein